MKIVTGCDNDTGHVVDSLRVALKKPGSNPRPRSAATCHLSSTRFGRYQRAKMKRYIIMWNAGFGSTRAVIEAESLAQAEKEAFEQWQEEVQNNAEFGAEEWTEEDAYEHDLLDDEELEAYEKKHYGN